MKHIKIATIPAREEEVIDKVTCDMCGEEISYANYSAEEVEISCITGKRYPECGSGEKIEVDMCVKCFIGKLVPLLISQGVKPTTTEWSW